MKIVAFGHRKRVGKDTAARFLISHLQVKWAGIKVVKAGFADKLKAIGHDLYGHLGLMDAEFYEQEQNAHLRYVKLAEINKTPVEIWIGLGNGVRDAVYDATWLAYLLKKTKCDIMVVKDMRFPIEADAILDRGGRVYRIDRADVKLDRDGADDQLLSYDRWTGTIDNSGDLNELYKKIVQIGDSL